MAEQEYDGIINPLNAVNLDINMNDTMPTETNPEYFVDKYLGRAFKTGSTKTPSSHADFDPSVIIDGILPTLVATETFTGPRYASEYADDVDRYFWYDPDQHETIIHFGDIGACTVITRSPLPPTAHARLVHSNTDIKEPYEYVD